MPGFRWIYIRVMASIPIVDPGLQMGLIRIRKIKRALALTVFSLMIV